MARRGRRCIVFDPLNQYKQKHSEFTIVVNTPVALKQYIKANFSKDWKILYVPKEGTVLKHWKHVGRIAYGCGNLNLVLDEIGLLCEHGYYKKEIKGQDPILESMVSFGRHRCVNIIATTQVPSTVALHYRSLCCEMRLFQIDEKAYLDYIQDRIGAAPTSLLPGLPKFTFVHWRDTGEFVKVKSKG